MGRTPDRRPGPLEEEEIQLSPPPEPSETDGSIYYDGSAFVMQDAAGAFNPRSRGQVEATGLTTTGLGNGDFGYLSAAGVVSLTDAAAAASSRVFGANEGISGTMTVAGVIEAAKFTVDGGAPSPGAPVFLAVGSADGGTGAGKLSAAPPTAAGHHVAEVGICLDDANYAGSKTCKVLLQVKAPVKL